MRRDNIRIDFREIEWEVVDWMYVAQDRDNWWDLLNTAMNLRVSIKGGGFLDYFEWLLASQKGLCSMEIVGWFID
jgi:hypothetical protein